MATIKYLIGKRGGDRPEVIIRLKVNQSQRVQAKVKGIFVYREYWSDAKQRQDTSRKFVKEWEKVEMVATNKILADLKESVLQKCESANEEDVTGEWLTEQIDQILHPSKYEPKEVKPLTLMEAIDHFINDVAPVKILRATGKPMGAGTISQHKQTKKVIESYIKHLKRHDLELEEVNQDFYNSLVSYLYSQGYKQNTVGKHIKNVKAAINALPLAQRAKCEFVERNKCVTLAEDVDNIYLNEEELHRIADVELKSPHLDKVRDQFLLMAWTGCRYSDLHKLDKKHLTSDLKYFKIVQQKTGTKVTIPVLPETRRILEKYNYIVPKEITNQKFNEYLKEVALLAELCEDVTITTTELVDADNKKADKVEHHYKQWEVVTAHTARRSFATNMYKRNFPTLMIMKITGHKTEKAFLKYIKVDEDENAERMLELFEAQMKNQLINL